MKLSLLPSILAAALAFCSIDTAGAAPVSLLAYYPTYTALKVESRTVTASQNGVDLPGYKVPALAAGVPNLPKNRVLISLLTEGSYIAVPAGGKILYFWAQPDGTYTAASKSVPSMPSTAAVTKKSWVSIFDGIVHTSYTLRLTFYSQKKVKTGNIVLKTVYILHD